MPNNNIITRSDAEALIPVEESKEIITAVRQSSAALSLMRKLPNMTAKQRTLPVLSSLPVAGFVNGDNGLKAVSAAAWDKKIITAEEIAVIIPIPEAVLDDAQYDVWAELKPSIVEAFGKVIDAAIFFSVNKPTSWENGIVTSAISKGNVITRSNVSDIVQDINLLMGKVEEDGFDVTGFAGDISNKSSLRGLRDQNGGLLFQPSLTADTPSTLYAQPINYVKNSSWDKTQALLVGGDFSQAVYAIRQDMTYKILDQAVISDGDGRTVLCVLAGSFPTLLRH